MRRSRFATSAAQEPTAKGRWLEALSFDLRTHLDGDDSIAAQRLAHLTQAPILLALAHAVSAGLILLHCFITGSAHGTATMALVAAGVLALDGGWAFLNRILARLGANVRTMTIWMCGMVALSTVAWCIFGYVAAHDSQTIQNVALAVLIGGGFVACVVAVIGSPPLAVTCALTGTICASYLQDSPMLTIGSAFLSLVFVVYSVLSARTTINVARERLSLDQEAHKALQFVNEFETSGRGWFWETNSQGTLSYVSQQLADDFHCQPEALLGRQFTDLLSVDSGTDNALREDRTLGFHLSARFPFSDVIVRAATNEDIHWSLSGNPIFDSNGRFMGFRGIGTDLTEQRRSEQEITRLARFDSLTGLPNRAMMRQTLEEALRNAARRQKGCALFLIDLDRFKNVNDTLGHPIGDALLRQVGERLKAVMGNHGQVGRLGGDEFIAVLPGTVETGLLEALAKTLIEQVSRPYSIEGHKVSIGASVGIAIGDPGRGCADALVRNADLALYAAKAAGRGKHCFYEQSMHSEATDRQALENDLRQALDRGELSVVYQPIVRSAGEDVCGFEALVRWDHPTRGPISPAKFIPLAEECGMIEKVGTFVLDTAVEEATHWPDSVRVAVNLSPIQFNNPTIIATVAAVLDTHKLRAGRLELEITEGVFLADSDATDETFANLKSLGVRLALDDFGTGYSSLGYLKKAPLDKIKIDQSFVRGAASTSSRNAAIIRAIVSLAESLGMDTTAEGVETHDDLQLIRELGVSQIQGYIFGRPCAPEKARELAGQSSVEADGYSCVREPRQSLMRRAVTAVDGELTEVRLRNISANGALVECPKPVSPDMRMTIDIVGVGPVAGTVRWAHATRFGLKFDEDFDLRRLTPKREKLNDVTMMTPWYVSQSEQKAAG
ncbi:MAG TPA: EAL domain-containing protein [Sphingomicrobium sp.]|nr:EAL domain-containing protein [Sphingomicrobium sp.]